MVAAIYIRPKCQITSQIKAWKEPQQNRYIMHFSAPNPKEQPLHLPIIVNLHIKKQNMELKSDRKTGQTKGRGGVQKYGGLHIPPQNQ